MKISEIPCTFNFTNVDPIALIEGISDDGNILSCDNKLLFFCDGRSCSAEYELESPYMRVKADKGQWDKIEQILKDISGGDINPGLLFKRENSKIKAMFVEN